MIERLDEPERKRRLLAALDRLDANRRPVPPLERRVLALEAVVRQLLELPVVRHSGVVTATMEQGE